MHLVVLDGEENPVHSAPSAVEELPQFLVKEVVFKGKGAATGHSLKRLDRTEKPVHPGDRCVR